MKALKNLTILLLLSLVVFSSSCDGKVTVVYRDGYITVSNIPSNIKTVTLKLSVRNQTYNTTITAGVENGTSEPICIGAMFRTTYNANQINIIARDEDAEVVADVKNKEPITINGTTSTQQVPFDKFK